MTDNSAIKRNELKINRGETSRVIQWLRLSTPSAGNQGSIPGLGTRSATKTQCSQINQ